MTDVGPGTPYDFSNGLLRPPAEAVALSAVRALPDGSMRQYSAAGFHRGWGSVEHFVRTLRAVGYIKPSGTTGYAVLDVLDVNDDIVFDYCLPTAPAFAFVKRKLQLTVVHPPQEVNR